MFASCATTLFTGTLCVWSKFNGADAIVTAMAFQQVVHLGYRVCGLIHISGDFEKKLASVQKCFKLLEIPQENKGQERYTKTTWPKKGAIKFEDVELKYRPGTEMVLRKLNFGIKAGEKIGVVGRTGAGKSTMTLAMTRIIEICGGKIEVDGVDINQINLQQVRESITIIPQEPTLFKGTLRFNLDPEKKRDDKEILKLLEDAGLVELILKKKKEDEEKKKKLDAELTPEQLASALSNKEIEDDSLLNFHVQTGGSNLSSGEKSLVCICRAILKKNLIVVLDEATANIDIETE
jgi:ABC-type multidrug transport system fused ATPase/permease subunit